MNMRVIAAVMAALLALSGVVLYIATQPTRSEPPPRATAAPATAPSAPGAESAPAAAAAPNETSRPALRRRTESTPDPAPAAPAEPVTAAPSTGTLRIEADVPGAQVFLDRQFLGTAPVTAENVTPGAHQLNVSAEGFEGIARTIDVAPGPRDVSIRFREVRLDASLSVVHKHGIGSCTGRLVATAQGLRYDTANAEDRFEVGLGDLETFAVDYREKNLRVKVRAGKQYNFTDPDGSADRLFVFHRDVDRARQRLAKGDAPATD